MIRELDPSLRDWADQILETKSSLVGMEYCKSPVKLVLDRLVAAPAFVSVSPVLALCGAAIWVHDGHWPFVDVGSTIPGNGHYVPCHKLRTMVPDAQALEWQVVGDGTLSEIKRDLDVRVTRVGRRLRKTSVDELPQLLNVALGHMSLVGPRKPSITEWEKQINPNIGEVPYSGFVELLHGGLKFGGTGLYVVMGRDRLDFLDRMWLENLYGQKASLKGDLRIMAMTFRQLRNGR